MLMRVGLMMPMAGRVGDSLPDFGEDLGRNHHGGSVGLLFCDLDHFLRGDHDADLCLLDLGDHNLFLVVDVLSDLDRLLVRVGLGDHDVEGNILSHGDVASDRHIVALVDRNLDGHLNVVVLSLSDGCASAFRVAAAAVPLALAAALLLVAAALVLELLDRCHGLVVHHGLLDGPPCLLGSSLRHPVSLLPGLRRLDHSGLLHIARDIPHLLSGLGDHLGHLNKLALSLHGRSHHGRRDHFLDGAELDLGRLDHPLGHFGHLS